MRQIATFYTYFWIVYFPTCIAYNDLQGFSYVDEVMTVILIGYTLLKHKSSATNKRPWREFRLYLVILLLYILYSLVLAVNIQQAVFRDMVQWIRPFSVIYCTWILNPRFNKIQIRLMLGSMVATLLSWIAYHPEVGLGGEAEFPVLGQLAMTSGMSWFLFTRATKKNKLIALALVLSGMLAPKFKYMGEVVCFISLMFVLKNRLKFKSPKTIAAFVVMIAAILYVTWSKFEVYYVSGMERDDMARPLAYLTSLKIFVDFFPLGSGMGTFGVAAAADFYSPLYYKYHLDKVWGLMPENPMFLADAFYPTLAQFGVVGVLLFGIFWKRRLLAFNRITDMRYYKVAFMSFFCLALEQTADSSFLSGKGMGYCMLIGLCLNANRNMGVELNSVENFEELDNEESEGKHIYPRRRRGLFRLGHNFKANRWRKDRENV